MGMNEQGHAQVSAVSQKPVFSTSSHSIKQILKVLFLPMRPKGRGCFYYVIYPLLLLMKIWVLLAMLSFIICGFAVHPGFFIGAIIAFLWFSPGIIGIIAFKGKMVQSALESSDLKMSVIQKMKAMGVSTYYTRDDNTLEFELSNVDKSLPPGMFVEIVGTQNNKASFARICMSNTYSEGGELHPAFGDDASGCGFIIVLFFRLFVTNSAGKVNKVIKQLAEELQNDSYQTNIKEDKPSQQEKPSGGTRPIKAATAPSTVGKSAPQLLSEDQVGELFTVYMQGSTAAKGIQVMVYLPETQDEADRFEKLSELADQEFFPDTIDRFIKLVKKDNKFSIMHKQTNTEYFQTNSRGVVLTKFVTTQDDNEVSEMLRAEKFGALFIFSFLGLPESELSHYEAFIDLGKELAYRLNSNGIPGAEVEVYEGNDNVKTLIYSD